MSRACAALDISPAAVTAAGVILSGSVAVVALAAGAWLFLAAGLVAAAAVADTADGALAAGTFRITRRGAFYDSMADRISETLWLLALWLAGVPGALVAACGALVWLHEYARARSAAVGLPGTAVFTVGERAVRVLVVVVAFAIGGALSFVSDPLAAGAMTVVVAVWLVLGLLGGLRLLDVIRSGPSGPGS